MPRTYVRSRHVFINCPFDLAYKPIFNALVFAVYDLGFRARCALEIDDAGDTRRDKILRIISECKYGVHDISATELNPIILPRFNMPLELGLYLGCKRYGPPAQRSKAVLILDREPYRYRNFISDVAGQDILAHGADPRRAMIELRNWLASKAGPLPGGAESAGNGGSHANRRRPLGSGMGRPRARAVSIHSAITVSALARASWRVEPSPSSPSPARLHFPPQHFVHVRLVFLPSPPKPREHLRIHPQADQLFDGPVEAPHLAIG